MIPGLAPVNRGRISLATAPSTFSSLCLRYVLRY